MVKKYTRTADRGDGTYLNPILFGRNCDFSVLKDGKDYWMVIPQSSGNRSIFLLQSRDLVNWKRIGYLIDYCPSGELDLVKVDDTYYIYMHVGEKTRQTWSQDIVVTTAKSMLGPWTKPEMVLEDSFWIDPGHGVDKDGTRYLYLAHDIIAELTPDGKKLASEPAELYPDWPIPDEFDIEALATEAPKTFWKDGWCYLQTTEGGTAGPPTAHGQYSFRSRSAKGPWEASPFNPISHTDSRDETWWLKGHGTVIEGPDDKTWYILYHAALKDNHQMGRMCLMEPLEWTEDGWYKIPAGIRPDRPIAMPKGGEKIEGCELGLSDDFDSGKLGLQWCALGDIDARCTFTDKGLELQCEGEDPYDTHPLVVHNDDVSKEIIAELTVEPGAAGGVTFSYDGDHVYAITLMDGIVRVHHRKRLWMANKYYTVEHPDNHIFLKIKCDDAILSPWYSDDGVNWKKINLCADVRGWHGNNVSYYESTKAKSGFRSEVAPGIMAFGKGKVTFRKFIYKHLSYEL